MSTVADRAIAIARRWIGTPYRHQAACCGAGADCLGLIRGIWRELYGTEPEPVPAYSMDWSEPQREERLWLAARRHMRERRFELAQPGDVMLFRMRDGAVAKHMGLLCDSDGAPGFIHAYSGRGVIESPLSQPWQRRIVACFQFP